MLKIKDDIDLQEKLYKEFNYEWDGFNERYAKKNNNVEISVYIYNRSVTTTYYDRYDEGVEYSEEDSTLEELKEYAPELLNLVEKIDT